MSKTSLQETVFLMLFLDVAMHDIDRFYAQLQSNKVSVYNKTGKCLQMQAIMTDEEFGQLELYPDFSIRFYSEKRCRCIGFRNTT